MGLPAVAAAEDCADCYSSAAAAVLCQPCQVTGLPETREYTDFQKIIVAVVV